MPVLRILALAALYFFLAAGLILAFALPGYNSFMTEHRETRIAEARGHIALFRDQAYQALFTAGAQLRMLGFLTKTDQALSEDAQDHRLARQSLATHFVRVVTNFRTYDQLRLLDSRGNERVRVNRQGDTVVRVPDTGLQYKGDRDYFRAVHALGPDQIFMSAADLNQENGRLEYPLNPTIRIATQVIDQQEQMRGAVIANLAVGDLFKNVERLVNSGRLQAEVSVLNKEGYWMFAQQPDTTWGWLLGRSDQTLARQNPALWQAISSSEQSTVLVPEGVYLSETIYPLEAFAGARFSPVTLQALGQDGARLTEDTHTLRWVVMVFIPKSAWQNDVFLHQPGGQFILGALLLAMALAGGLLARQHVMRRVNRDLEKRYATELSDLYEHAPCGYQSVNGDGLFVRINETGLAWLGYERSEVVGKLHYSQVLLPDARTPLPDPSRSHLDIIKAEGELMDHLMLMRRKDGSMFPVSVSARAVYDEGGRFVMTRTTIVDVTERRLLEDTLRSQAFTDELTGAVNRRHFNLLAADALESARQTGRSYALMAMDIDHFKKINDTYGHAAGDLALQAFVQACLGALRAGDQVARMGGEEFAVLLPDASLETASQVAERVRQAVAAIRVPVGEDRILALTVSIGLTVLDARGESLDAALSRADHALYMAKHQGRDRVVTG